MLIKSLQKIGTIAAILSVATVSSASPLLSESALQISLEFPPAPNRPGANSSAGGGTRGSDTAFTASGRSAKTVCSQGELPLTALTPKDTEIEKTVSARPDFFLYIPDTSAKTAEFLVLDALGDDVYADTLELPETPGILQVSLPDSVTLEVGQTYSWEMVMNCDSDNPIAIESVYGDIERTELSDDLKTQIEATDEPLKQAELYAQQRIWQDTLMLMAELRESNQAEWEQLLKSVGLEGISAVPLIKN